MPQVDKDISTLGTNPEMTRAYLGYFELDPISRRIKNVVGSRNEIF